MERTAFHIFPFYPQMNEADQKLLRSSVLIKELKSGQIMSGDHTRCTGIPMILRGRVRLFRLSEKGREMTIYRVRTGEMCLFVGMCAMGNLEYDFTVEAEKDCVLATLPPEAFSELLYRSAPFSSFVFAAFAQKLVLSIKTIEMLIFNSIEERIMAYLQRHANASGEVKVTHEQMAVELGSSREVISRELRKMSEKALVNLKRGRVIVNYLCE